MRRYQLITGVLAILFIASGCAANPTPAPAPQPTAAATQPPALTAAPAKTATPEPSATVNALGMVFVAQYDPTRQILTIYGTTPGATIIFNGTPLVPPPTATSTKPPPPTATPTRANTPVPVVVAPPPTRPPAPAITEASLRGKILFKSTRDGGSYPGAFNFYAMNPDGSGVQKLDTEAVQPLYITLQGREGFSPDGARVVLGERACYGYGTCSLYILDTVLDAKLINSNDDISHGQWISYKGSQAKDPVWSPASRYIVFVSNHESPGDCVRSPNIFKATPGQNPTVRRLTDHGDFCAGGDVGHPSFNGDGSKIAFWGEGSGIRQIYILDVGSDDNFDFRMANPRTITNHQFDDWDPLWVK